MRLDARLARQWSPAELGVHPVVGGGPLPAYVRRPHDERLRLIVAPPVEASRLVVVRGEPGTGTTRAAWEAVAGELAEWPLEYPRTAAALAARLEAGIPAGTVLWLGELGRYVRADNGAARAFAARAAADAPQASLADPGGAADLLTGLRTAGYDEAARALLDRDHARQARLERRHGVARLIAALRAAGAGEAAATLARRAAGAGLFSDFLSAHPDRAASYRYGSEPDLAPAPPWRWSPPAPPATG